MDDNGEKISKEKKKGLLRFMPYIATFLVVFVLFQTVFGFHIVQGESMEDTFIEKDALLCFRFGSPKRGDVVVCKMYNEERTACATIVKRVVAIGGDTLVYNYDTGEVSVNDVILKEEYIKPEPYCRQEDFVPTREDGVYTIPSGCYFVMGDNRNHSYDSRYRNLGVVEQEDIVGTLLFRMPIIGNIM